MNIEELEAAALKLEPKSRARLAELLLESLERGAQADLGERHGRRGVVK